MNNTRLSNLLGIRVLDQMNSISRRTRHHMRYQHSSTKRLMEESDSNSDAQVLPGMLGPTKSHQMSTVVSPPKFCGWFKKKLTRLELGSCYIPNTNLMCHQRDAHFLCQHNDIFGVADGSVYSRDAFVYAETLMFNALMIAKQEQPSDDDNWPSVILKKSIGLTEEVIGGSTACVLALQGKNIIASKIGNSGFLVIRNGEVVYRSRLHLRFVSSASYAGSSLPPLCVGSWLQMEEENVKVSVEEGDVVVAATDGMFHNLFDDAILKITTDGKRNNLSPSIVSANLAEAARQVSLNKMCDTPFRKARRDDYGVVDMLPKVGGKRDEVTVIVGNVVSREIALVPGGGIIYL